MNDLNELHKHMIMRLAIAMRQCERTKQCVEKGLDGPNGLAASELFHYSEGVVAGLRQALDMVKAIQSDVERQQS